jgi:hypothetical protein
MVGEAIGSTVFNRKTGKAINTDTDHVSAGRIGYGVGVTLIFLVIIFAVAGLLDMAWGDFWDANFSRNW